MPDKLASSDDEDVAQPYRPSAWISTSSGNATNIGPAESNLLSYCQSGSSLDPMPNKYGPGLLGDVQPIQPLALEGSPGTGPTGGQAGATRYSVGSNFYGDAVARPNDEGGILWIGNPTNRRLRKEWSQKSGLDWPQDPVTGRNYDVAHIVAKADGGKDHVDNIRPMHPYLHMAEHTENGDTSRWGKRASIARAFGGKVARSLAPFEVLNGLLGVLSGRIRTNDFNRFSSDVLGYPSQEDELKAFERLQKLHNPSWKPGDPYST